SCIHIRVACLCNRSPVVCETRTRTHTYTHTHIHSNATRYLFFPCVYVSIFHFSFSILLLLGFWLVYLCVHVLVLVHMNGTLSILFVSHFCFPSRPSPWIPFGLYMLLCLVLCVCVCILKFA